MNEIGRLRETFAYNRAVYGRFLRRLARSPWRSATRDRGTAQGSIRNTMVHIVQVHEIWMSHIVPGRLGELDRTGHTFEELRSWTAVRAYARQVFEEVDRRLARLRPRDLDRVIRAPWMPGRYTVRDAFWQTTFEQAHHLGEINAVLWQQDRAPPDMTWIDVRRARR